MRISHHTLIIYHTKPQKYYLSTPVHCLNGPSTDYLWMLWLVYNCWLYQTRHYLAKYCLNPHAMEDASEYSLNTVDDESRISPKASPVS